MPDSTSATSFTATCYRDNPLADQCNHGDFANHNGPNQADVRLETDCPQAHELRV